MALKAFHAVHDRQAAANFMAFKKWYLKEFYKRNLFKSFLKILFRAYGSLRPITGREIFFIQISSELSLLLNLF